MVGGKSLEVEALLHMVDGGGSLNHRGPTPNRSVIYPQQEQGNAKTYTENQCWQCGKVGHLKKSCPLPKRQGAVTGRECLNSPNTPRHSPIISYSTNMGGKRMARNSIDRNNSSNFF